MSRQGRPGMRGVIDHKLAATGSVVAAAVAVAGLGAAPAQSAPDASCPAPYPISALTADQPVTGLTVTKGTTPEGFTGTVLGVMHDGIAPGIDMIMARLTSPELTRVGGIWEGMSGSPVYAADGRLIGAVAYGLATGPSTVAGVTPAADMEGLLTTPPPLAKATFPKQVAIPRTIARRIVTSGSATGREVSGGLSQLRLPFAISGLTSSAHFKKLKKLFASPSLRNAQQMQAGAGGTSDASNDIVPGGNLAASVSYGDVTSAGVGTATAVCGSEVLAFGHPMNATGPATLTMHGADAIYIQEDPTYAGFKVANITAPVGTITDDRTVGLRGVLGAAPATADITSVVRMGSASRTGTTHISVPDAVADLATTHLLADEDRIFDGIGKGSATVGWVIHGTRADGAPFRLARTDEYADPSDLTFATALDFNNTLYAIVYNGVEDVKITSISTTSTLSRDYLHYTLGSIKARQSGSWKSVSTRHALKVTPGTTKRFQVSLTSAGQATRTVVLAVPIPKRAAGQSGYLDIFGGNNGSSDGGDGEASGQSTAGSFSDVLNQLRSAPHHNDVVASLNFSSGDGTAISRTRHARVGHVVDGDRTIEVRAAKK